MYVCLPPSKQTNSLLIRLKLTLKPEETLSSLHMHLCTACFCILLPTFLFPTLSKLNSHTTDNFFIHMHFHISFVIHASVHFFQFFYLHVFQGAATCGLLGFTFAFQLSPKTLIVKKIFDLLLICSFLWTSITLTYTLTCFHKLAYNM